MENSRTWRRSCVGTLIAQLKLEERNTTPSHSIISLSNGILKCMKDTPVFVLWNGGRSPGTIGHAENCYFVACDLEVLEFSRQPIVLTLRSRCATFRVLRSIGA